MALNKMDATTNTYSEKAPYSLGGSGEPAHNFAKKPALLLLLEEKGLIRCEAHGVHYFYKEQWYFARWTEAAAAVQIAGFQIDDHNVRAAS